MKTYNWLYPLCLLIGLSSCRDVTDVELSEGENLLSVDGWITSQPGPYTIRLTRTAPYFTNTPAPGVQGAVVTITDNEGNSEILQEQAPGQYVTSQLQGKIGNSYTLNIQANGEEYMAQTRINRVPRIDSLKVRYREASGFIKEGFYAYYYGPELQGMGDCYRFKIYKDDVLLNNPENLILAEDKLIDGNYINNVQMSFDPFPKGATVRVETWAITEDAYRFYFALRSQIRNVGLFANPPSNVPTNIVNKTPGGKQAVGWFGGAGVSSKEVIIQ